nr:MAG TPA: hypothetical protein [Caudoviricetes sp.]
MYLAIEQSSDIDVKIYSTAKYFLQAEREQRKVTTKRASPLE